MSELRLSTRQIQVLKLAASGYTTYQIARILCCSYHTVCRHKRRAFQKVGAFSLVHAIVLAHQLGLLDVSDIEPLRVPTLRD